MVAGRGCCALLVARRRPGATATRARARLRNRPGARLSLTGARAADRTAPMTHAGEPAGGRLVPAPSARRPAGRTRTRPGQGPLCAAPLAAGLSRRHRWRARTRTRPGGAPEQRPAGIMDGGGWRARRARPPHGRAQ